MKKIFALVLAAVMLLSFAACGGSVKVESSLDILTAVWDKYAEEDKFFCIGGDPTNQVDNKPAVYDLKASPDAALSQLVCGEDCAKMVDNAAMIMHAMNSNNFTGAAYHVAEGNNPQTFIDYMEEAISNNQWICGFPEKLLAADLGDGYVVIVFGAGDLVETFKTNLTKVFADAKIAVEKAL